MHSVNPLSLGIIGRHAISCLHMVKAIGSNNVEVKHLRNEVVLKRSYAAGIRDLL